ncbi:TPA: hypothetical protein ACOAUT_002798, partial [Enterococcus faecalis]
MKKIFLIFLFGFGVFLNFKSVYAENPDPDKVTTWIAKQVQRQVHLEGIKLGYKIGDKVSKDIIFPDEFFVQSYQGEDNWNGPLSIQLGGSDYPGSFVKYNNVSFSNSEDIKVSISGFPTDFKRTITVERLKYSNNKEYSIRMNYEFLSKGVIANNKIILPFNFNTVIPKGEIETVLKLGAVAKEDQTMAKLKNVDLYVGDDFDPNSVIENVQDADGNKIRAEDIDYYYIDEVKTKRLDTSKPGEYKVRVVVQNGQKQWVYSNTAIVTVKNALTVEPAPQTTSLGIATSNIDYSNFVKNVKLGDQLLPSDQYKIELINNLAIDTIGTKTAKIRVTLKSDTSKTVDVDVPYTVRWGNSVVFGSYARPAGRTSAAFTLYPENIPYIVASQGGTSDDNDPIHEIYGADQYYTFNWFNLSNKPYIQISESDSGNKFIKAKGIDL